MRNETFPAKRIGFFHNSYFIIRNSFRAFSVIEALVAAAIIAIGLVGIETTYTLYVRSTGSLLKSTQAMLLAEEGIEATKLIRDNGWSTSIGTYSVGTPYYLTFSGNMWSLSTLMVPEVDHTFFRTTTFSAVNRAANDQIVVGAGTNDPNTRLAVVQVSWVDNSATSSVSLSTYVDNLFTN